MAVQSIFVVTEKTDALGELCFGARKLADQVTAVVFGDQSAAESAAACGAQSILYCPLDSGCPEDYCKAIAAEIRKVPSALVLLSNSIRGRCIAGKLGVYLDTAVMTCVSEIEKDGDRLIFKRTVYGGSALRTQVFSTPYGVVTLGSGVFGEADSAFAKADSIAKLPGEPESTFKLVARQEKKGGGTNLAAAKRIVDVGRGLAAQEDLEMCHKLASLLGAEVGCSRPVAENNKWMPIANYIGLTGVSIKPELLFIMGVSGQVQHLAGISKSKLIVAVNKDKNAPIFKNADFGLVGDIYKIIPALIEKLS